MRNALYGADLRYFMIFHDSCARRSARLTQKVTDALEFHVMDYDTIGFGPQMARFGSDDEESFKLRSDDLLGPSLEVDV